jgi:ATP-dependent helicase/nuclease subunit B
MATQPRVFNIPASAPFLPTLIQALIEGRLVPGFPAARDPLALASATIYLPTRRACRLARDAFLGTLASDAAILPRIVPLGDIDEDEIEFAEAAGSDGAGAALDLPKAIDGIERKVLLSQLILRWAATPRMRRDGVSRVANSPAAAFLLASDLARLMDDMVTRQVPWDRLKELVPLDVDRHWQDTLEFLAIAWTAWPEALRERDRIEPAERRNRLIEAEAKRLAGSRGPVIAAGSTGSIPATAALLATIAKLPDGAVVLPGLDMRLEPAAWDLISGRDGKDEPAHGHPQFAMHALLRRIGVTHEAVTPLAEPAPHGREWLASEVLRPAGATERWQERLAEPAFATHADGALATVASIEAANAEEEALAIAVALREAMEEPGKTAALVTPDRALARRVLAALARWGVPVDDSAGDTLASVPAGIFGRLVAEVALGGLAPVTLLALLKHRLCGVDRHAIAALERAVLRGPRPQPGTAGLADALATFRGELARLRRREASSLHRSDPRTWLKEAELDAAAALVEKLKRALAPLETLAAGTALPLAAIAKRHAEVIKNLGVADDSLDKAFDAIFKADGLAIAPADYSELFHATIADWAVRRPETNARVRIFGLLEARLQTVDRLVLGGLVEGVWPPETRADPWLNRPMRHTLGLDLPERRVGLTAHDFAQALGAKEVIVSRAAKLSGAPTVASRFVQRLAAVAGERRWAQVQARGARYVELARRLDAPTERPRPVARPEPTPPRDARPKSLSVTEIELWLRDPYSIYARHVLDLRPLDAIDTPPGARDRGIVIHGAIGDFTVRFKERLPDDIVGELLRLGEQHFAMLRDFPDARAFWWPRFQRIARWFAEFEAKRRGAIARIDAEIQGRLEIPLGEGRAFVLTARADRIEQRSDGSYAILDYKTGRVPSAKEVRSGLAPQLTLEGAIVRAGCFGEIPKGASIGEFAYVSMRGVNQPGEEKPIAWRDTTPDAESDRALARLTGLIQRFDDPATPYRSLERPMFMRRNEGEYDHLSRVREWSLSGGEDDAEERGE